MEIDESEESIQYESLSGSSPSSPTTGSAKHKAEEVSVRDKKRLRVHNSCPFLPLEVLAIIFSYLGFNERKRVRLVCKSWYSECNRNENIRIQSETAQEHFESCGLQNLNSISFDRTSLNRWSTTVWEKTGASLQSLNLHYCQLGNETIKSLILLCDNLRILRVKLKNYDPDYSFCSAETLEEIDFVQKKLETLEICGQRFRFFEGPAFNYHGWRRIFAALLGIFQNTVCFIGGHRDEDEKYFVCSFSAEVGAIDKLELSSSMAFLLSGGDASWRNAFDVLSSTRFTAFSLEYSRFPTDHLREGITAFFEKQRQLKSVKIKLGLGRGLQVPSERETLMMEIIAFCIARNCCELQELEFNQSRSRCLQHKSCLTSAHPQFYTQTLNVKKLSVDSMVQRSSLSLSLNSNTCWESIPSNLFLISSHPHIEHLTLTNDISNNNLQAVFQYMTNLKTLDIYLDAHNTSFGLTGRRKENSEHFTAGYSIKCLTYLEKLTIRCRKFDYDDTVFEEFDFPKLRYLDCFKPKALSTFSDLALRLPCLEEIAFQMLHEPLLLLDFCKFTEKLHTIRLPNLREILDICKVTRIFEVRPFLKTLSTKNRTYFYEPFSKEVRCLK